MRFVGRTSLSCIFLSCALFLSGFFGGYVDLYTQLNQEEANKILVLLMENDIEAEKEEGKEGVSVRVPGEAVSKSIALLEQNGLPREKFDTLGNVFKKDGLISTPSEERMRLIYALSQELASTISNIDGVLISRVHVVLPKVKDMKAMYPSSVSVFVKHAEGVDMDPIVPKIKMLVVNSIEGLEYDKVSVLLFPQSYKEIPEIKENGYQLLILAAMSLLLLLGGGGAAAFFFIRKGRASRNEPQEVLMGVQDGGIQDIKAQPDDAATSTEEQ